MVRFKHYSRSGLFERVRARALKVPSVMDESDLLRYFRVAIDWLDENVFAVRSVLIDQAALDPDGFVDVSCFGVDTINHIYYSPGNNNDVIGIGDPGVGLLPLLQGAGGGFMGSFSGLSDLTDYLVLQTTLNQMTRYLQDAFDWYLWPVDSLGRQLLQIKNPGEIFIMCYLPRIGSDDDVGGWLLLPWEAEAVEELAYLEYCRGTAEAEAMASVLGLSEKATGLVSVWESRIQKFKDDWQEKVTIQGFSS